MYEASVVVLAVIGLFTLGLLYSLFDAGIKGLRSPSLETKFLSALGLMGLGAAGFFLARVLVY